MDNSKCIFAANQFAKAAQVVSRLYSDMREERIFSMIDALQLICVDESFGFLSESIVLVERMICI